MFLLPVQKDKRVRVGKDELDQLIFKAFETHQYYTLKNIADRTDQPVAFVKEALKEVCTKSIQVLNAL
jgi:transcription initiation factor TFIIF subunit beta